MCTLNLLYIKECCFIRPKISADIDRLLKQTPSMRHVRIPIASCSQRFPKLAMHANKFMQSSAIYAILLLLWLGGAPEFSFKRERKDPNMGGGQIVKVAKYFKANWHEKHLHVYECLPNSGRCGGL